MVELEFSHMSSVEIVDLDKFERQAHLHVKLKEMNWDTAWGDLLQIALYNQGPDISEIGNTWLGSLAGMNALRPFRPQEIRYLGGPEVFIASAWQSSSLPDEDQIIAIPWLTDTRLICYRRDLLAKAGIDEKTAFQTPENLLETLACLEGIGISGPFIMPTTEEVLHNLASWVWGAGGDFRTPDYKHLSIAEPEALHGITNFFKLHQYFAPEGRGLDIWDSDNVFLKGEAAVALTGHWLKMEMNNHDTVLLEVVENLGVCKIPGIPFVGGSSLVLWKHTLQERGAIELIRYLTNPQTQSDCCRKTSMLPTRIEVLAGEPFEADPFYQVIADNLKIGRAFQSSNRWAAVELRLAAMINQFWADLFTHPEFDLQREVVRRVTDVTNKIERTLLSA